METWTWMFGEAGGDISTAQMSARAALIFAYGLLLVRLSGRRAFGRWAAIDIVVAIMAGSNLSRAITGSAPLIETMVATAALMAMHWLGAQAAARWRMVSALVEGRPRHLVRDGALDHRAAKRDGVSLVDIEEAVRRAGVADIAETRSVVLEPSGKLSVVPR